MRHIASIHAGSAASNVDADMISSNAIDMRLDRVFAVSDDMFVIDEKSKEHRSRIQVSPDDDGYYNLGVGVYDVAMSSTVSIADGEAGWLVIRSTFNRNGVFITSGIYDSGYSGVVGGALHVNAGPVRVKHGTRVAQFVLTEAETLKMYDGDYGSGSKPMEQALYGEQTT